MTEQLKLDLDALVTEPSPPAWMTRWVLSTACPDCCRQPLDPVWNHNDRQWLVRWVHEPTCTASLEGFVLRPPVPLADRTGAA